MKAISLTSISLIIAVSGAFSSLFGQQVIDRGCGTTISINHPNYQNTIDQKVKMETQYLLDISTNFTGTLSNIVYTIPVVVHIIHNGSSLGSTTNLDAATVSGIIDESSQRFRHLHNRAKSYSNPNYGVDTEINLCLADKDPDGNYTDGIVRHYNPSFS